jgi:hypothetical protein
MILGPASLDLSLIDQQVDKRYFFAEKVTIACLRG